MCRSLKGRIGTYCLVFEVLKFIPVQCKPPCFPVLKDKEQMVTVLGEFSLKLLRKEKPSKLLACSGLQLCFVVPQNTDCSSLLGNTGGAISAPHCL